MCCIVGSFRGEGVGGKAAADGSGAAWGRVDGVTLGFGRSSSILVNSSPVACPGSYRRKIATVSAPLPAPSLPSRLCKRSSACRGRGGASVLVWCWSHDLLAERSRKLGYLDNNA